MKPVNLKALILFFTVSLSLASTAQTPEEIFEAYHRTTLHEKVVLNFDKPEYIAGETIFFKAHVLNGYRPSDLSTNLYTEMYDAQQKLIDKGIVPLFNGSGEGHFALPASLAENVYFIRAYTTNMLRYEAAFEYLKPVAVYNPVSRNRLQPKKAQWSAVALPEGGAMLSDEFTKLAIRLNAVTMLPVKWQADLYEKESGQPVAAVEVFNSQVGAVNFVPAAGKNYFVRITDNAGMVKEVPVPAVKEEGSQLRLSVSGDKVAYQLSTKNLASKGNGYKLIATLYDQLVFSGSIKNSTGSVTGIINVKELGSGVLRFAVFNEQSELVNERLCFIHPTNVFTTPVIDLDTVSFQAKGLNAWQLAADSSMASYTVKVATTSDYVHSDHFLAQVYLTADYPATAYTAGWFFSGIDAGKTAALDALLIAEQETRFSWAAMKNKKPAAAFPEENYLRYSATVRKGDKLQPLREINLVLKQGADSTTQFLQTQTDSTGSFSISDAIFIDTVRVFFQASSRKFLEKDIKIDFVAENKFRPYKGVFPTSAFEVVPRGGDEVSDAVKNAVAQRRNQQVLGEKSRVLEEIIVRTRSKNLKQELDRKYSSGLLGGANGTVFDFVNEDQSSALGYSNILQWLRGRVSGLIVNNVGGRISVQLRGTRSLTGSSVAAIYIDNMPVDADYLNGFPVANIAMIKVIKTADQASGANGAIAIYTKKGGEGSAAQTGTMPSSALVGYKKQPPYFWPDYGIPQFKENPDERQVLLFRTTFIDMDETGRQAIRFYNNDAAKAYRLTVTGFTAAGKPVYIDKIITGQGGL